MGNNTAKFFVNINGNLAEVGAGKSAYDLAVYNGFEGTEVEWLKSLKGKDGLDGSTVKIDSENKHWIVDGEDSGIKAEGIDGINGSIITMNPDNKHWLIDGVDTNITAEGKDGKSIQSITKDDNNNIIVTFTDDSVQNIGQLNIDISADFLTENGFGNIRYYQGNFQYYDKSNSSWINASATPDNTFYMGLTPNPMKIFRAKYDTTENVIKLIIKEPDDIVLEGQSICLVEKIVIRRKKDEIPQNIEDGIEVITIHRNNFGSYSKTPYIDNSFKPSFDEKWYYRAFPVSTLGIVNNLEKGNVSLADDKIVYGFILNQNESDPSSMITYIEENSNFESVHMDFENGVFEYGDWGNAWFIKDLKPVMLNYDGSVAYELDKDDFTKKKDGSDSGIADSSFEGNAMIGVPKVYWKIVDNGNDTCNVYFSNQKIDDDFNCYSHIDNNGNEIDYCYMPIYNGSLDSSNRLRSLSGVSPMVGQTGRAEITYAKLNNLTSDEIWYTEVYSDRILITLLLLLIGKSTDTQTVFGNGKLNANSSILKTGTMDLKGLFYGYSTSNQAVKVFGIENFWGNIWRRTAGYMYINGIQKIKMVHGKEDGSTVNGYNTTSEGYIEILNSQISGTNGGYIKFLVFDKNGFFVKQISGSSSTYYPDVCWFSTNGYALFGGDYSYNVHVGALCVDLQDPVSLAHARIGCNISCKPLAIKG